jgi:uncharacterized metal-binding protein YceD (DUF177 family)
VLVSFSKVTSSPNEYRVSDDGVELVSQLTLSHHHLVKANSTLKGEIAIECSRCLEEFTKEVDSSFELLLSDGEYRGNDSLDVIEFFDGKIDLDQVLKSEIESYRNDYHLCGACEALDEYEVEY